MGGSCVRAQYKEYGLKCTQAWIAKCSVSTIGSIQSSLYGTLNRTLVSVMRWTRAHLVGLTHGM